MSSLDGGTLTIDCDDCRFQASAACGDCLVSVLCGTPDAPLTMERSEVAAISVLGRSGLVPPVRHRPRRRVPA